MEDAFLWNSSQQFALFAAEEISYLWISESYFFARNKNTVLTDNMVNANKFNSLYNEDK